MMIKLQAVLSLLVKLGKNALAAKTPGFIYLPSLWTSPEEYVFLMFEAADAFVKNNHKPAFSNANSFYKHARPLAKNIHTSHFE